VNPYEPPSTRSGTGRRRRQASWLFLIGVFVALVLATAVVVAKLATREYLAPGP
jgi:hypothetical protein